MTVFRNNTDPDPWPATLAEIEQSAELAGKRAGPPTAEPFPDNDKWLADSVNELRQKDQEYKRLTTEQARGEWERTARANLARSREQAEQIESRKNLEHARDQALDDKHDLGLLKHMEELSAVLPRDGTATEWNVPVDLLRDYSKTMQELDQAAKRRGMPGLDGPQTLLPQPQAKPETFPDGQPYHITQNPDGTMHVEYVTGERFDGDPMTVTQKIAKAHVETKRWAQQQRSQASQPQSANAVTFRPDGVPQVDFAKIPDVAKWQLDQMAVALGYTDGTEMVNDQIRQRQEMERVSRELAEEKEQRENHNIASRFLGEHPDFPNTDESVAALDQVLMQNNLPYTPQTMAMAHAYAVKNGLYQPLSGEEIQDSMGFAARAGRPAPPPMVPSSAPDSTSAAFNPWAKDVKLEDLRAMAIRQQLEGKDSSLSYR